MNTNRSTQSSFRRFMTRAETATLIGMILVVSSLYLIWERHELQNPRPLPGMMYVSQAVIPRTGFGLPVAKSLILCALVSGGLLLFPPNAKTRLPLALVQGAAGLTCVVIALAHLALQPGVLCAFVGGVLLTFGAVDRYMVASQENGSR